MVLLGTTGYSVVLGCTEGHWLVLRVQDGSGRTVWYQRVLYWVLGYWVIQGGYMGVLGSIKGYCGVLGSKMRYCEVLWHIAVYSWVLLGSSGYWGALVSTKGTGGSAWYCWVLRDIETLLPISTPPTSSPTYPVAPSHTLKYPTVPHSTPLLLHSTSSTTQYSVVPPTVSVSTPSTLKCTQYHQIPPSTQ